MARAEKIIEKIKTKPTLSSIKWDELVWLLRRLGYEVLNGNGSRRKFHNAEKDHLINLHEPHPGNELKTYAIDQVREKLEEIGLI